jgi:hypothetical protein
MGFRERNGQPRRAGGRSMQHGGNGDVPYRSAGGGAARPGGDAVGAAQNTMHAPDTIEVLRQQGCDPAASDPDRFAAFIRSENRPLVRSRRYRRVEKLKRKSRANE